MTLEFIGDGQYLHYCPGCECLHRIHTTTPNDNGARWRYDGNPDRPTFAPSVNIDLSPIKGPTRRCHYFLRGGFLEYCTDSTHQFKGKIVPLPDIPEGMRWKE
jgi:hypothetical protein